MDGEEQLCRGQEEVLWISVVQVRQVVAMAVQVVTQRKTLRL